MLLLLLWLLMCVIWPPGHAGFYSPFWGAAGVLMGAVQFGALSSFIPSRVIRSSTIGRDNKRNGVHACSSRSYSVIQLVYLVYTFLPQ